jgi:hypothetical protein
MSVSVAVGPCNHLPRDLVRQITTEYAKAVSAACTVRKVHASLRVHRRDQQETRAIDVEIGDARELTNPRHALTSALVSIKDSGRTAGEVR